MCLFRVNDRAKMHPPRQTASATPQVYNSPDNGIPRV